MWRKYANELPRLLFRYDQVCVDLLPPAEVSDGQRTKVRVELRSSASEALETLGEVGLGWPAAVAAYSETMVRRGFAAGMVMARSHHLEQDDDESLDEDEWTSDPLAELDKISADTDLRALGVLLVHQLFEESEADGEDSGPRHAILDQLSLDGAIESVVTTVLQAESYAKEHELDVNVFALVRAVESWCVLNQNAPLIAWPVLMAAILRAVDPDLPLVYDLSDDAWEVMCVDTVADGFAYVDDYWRWSGEGLASSARVMGKLFHVLASFGGDLSREFWFARAADALLEILNPVRDARSTTMKKRGDLLEDLLEALVRTESPDLEVVERNLRTRGEEIDLVVSNGLSHPFWLAHSSPVLMFECKNTAKKVGVPDLRILESKLHDRNAICRIGVFVSMSGFTQPFYDRLRSIQASGVVIFPVTGQELAGVVNQKQRLTDWLRTRGLSTALSGRPS